MCFYSVTGEKYVSITSQGEKYVSIASQGRSVFL